MQGAGRHPQRQIVLHAEPGREVALRVDNPSLHFDAALGDALAMPRVEAWTSVVVGSMEPFDDLDLWRSSPDSAPAMTVARAAPSWVGGTVTPRTDSGAMSVSASVCGSAFLTAGPTAAASSAEFGMLSGPVGRLQHRVEQAG